MKIGAPGNRRCRTQRQKLACSLAAHCYNPPPHRRGSIAVRWTLSILLLVGDSMAATLYLLGCILIPGQTMMRPPNPSSAQARERVHSPTSGDWLLMPRLSRSKNWSIAALY